MTLSICRLGPVTYSRGVWPGSSEMGVEPWSSYLVAGHYGEVPSVVHGRSRRNVAHGGFAIDNGYFERNSGVGPFPYVESELYLTPLSTGRLWLTAR
jgi:hypothetical protein